MSVGVRENDNREDIRAILIISLFCITDATFAVIAEKTLFCGDRIRLHIPYKATKKQKIG